jgi:hypothetical protein
MSEADDPKRNEEAEGEPAPPAASGAPPDVETSSSDAGDVRDASTSASKLDEEDVDEAAFDEVDLREMMRQALERPPQGAPPDLLRGVQRRLRTRSRGKFYGDGWSTARAPRSTYLTTSILMLVLLAFVFLVLIPWGGGALPLP